MISHPRCSIYQYLILFHGRVIFHCMDLPHFVYPFFSWCIFDLFILMAIKNNAAMNICVQVFVWPLDINFRVEFSWGYYRSGILEFYGSIMYNFLTSWQTVFHSSCHILHSHHQCRKALVSPHLHQHLAFSFLKKLPSSWVWSCISLWFWFAFF